MKKLKLLMAVIAMLTFSMQQVSAQQIQIDVSNNNKAQGVDFILYAYDNSCNIVGYTYPIYAWQADGVYSYGSLSWDMDPGTPNCTTNYWYFGKAELYNRCYSTHSTGSTTCDDGNYDWLSVGESCGNYSDICFEFTGTCSTCSAGDLVVAHFGSGAGPCDPYATLNVNYP
jgi:hypothetical protein